MSPQETDAIFFPGSGGKPTKAKALCDTCPIMGACLKKACQENLQGFIAGTTEAERRVISNNWLDMKVTKPVSAFVADLMPKSLGKRRVFLKVMHAEIDTLAYLDTLEPSM